MFETMSLREFVDQAASDAPTPGGGAIAALAGSLGTAMAAMAANFTIGRPKFAAVETEAKAALERLKPYIASLLKSVDEDAEAFSAINKSYKLPKTTEEEKKARNHAVEQALAGAMRLPYAVLGDCLGAAEALPALAAVANPNLLSDVEVAAIMLEAAGRAAQVNVMVNARQLQGAETDKIVDNSAKMAARLKTLLDKVMAEAAERRR